MGTMLIDQLLSASIDQGASDLHIAPGKAPMVRVDGQLQRLGTSTLTPTDTYFLMECITPYSRLEEFQMTGGADFEFGFGEACRVHTSLMRIRGEVAIVLRLTPKDQSSSEQQG